MPHTKATYAAQVFRTSHCVCAILEVPVQNLSGIQIIPSTTEFGKRSRFKGRGLFSFYEQMEMPQVLMIPMAAPAKEHLSPHFSFRKFAPLYS